MNALARMAPASVPTLLATGGPWPGKLIFVGVFAVLLVWLLLVPDRLIGNADGRPPWWRNTRVWAILVCVTQIVVYLHWG